MIEVTAGRSDAAADRLLALTAPGRPDIDPTIALEAMPDAIEAGVRAGRPAEAAQRLEALHDLVTAAPTQGRQALLARGEALLGVRDQDEAFGEAIAAAPALPPLQRARTELLYGEWLRRERRRGAARRHLRTALEMFCTLGAVPLADRAETELRASMWRLCYPQPHLHQHICAVAASPTTDHLKVQNERLFAHRLQISSNHSA
jgi:hypothetical protein